MLLDAPLMRKAEPLSLGDELPSSVSLPGDPELLGRGSPVGEDDLRPLADWGVFTGEGDAMPSSSASFETRIGGGNLKILPRFALRTLKPPDDGAGSSSAIGRRGQGRRLPGVAPCTAALLGGGRVRSRERLPHGLGGQLA